MPFLTPAPVGTPGAAVTSANNVATPTTLTPATGSGYAVGDTLLCFTACSSATPTVATPAGWTSLLNVTGTNGRLALFAKVAASTSEAAPSVVWSGLTTGTTGTPCQAIVQAFTNLSSVALASLADVVGTAANGTASTATSAGGSAITTLTDKDLVLSLTTRLDDAFTTFTAPAGFTNVTAAQGSTSGSDFAMGWAYQVKTPAGAVTAPNFGLSGASSFASSGVMVALKAQSGAFDAPTGTMTMLGTKVESGGVSAYPALIMGTTGLVSYWRLSEASGNALDYKGSSPATVAGGITRQAAGLITGDPDQAVRGDGAIGTYLVATGLPLNPSQLTWECWVTIESYVSGRSILDRGYPFLSQTTNTGLRWYTRDVNSNDTIIDTSNTVKVGQRSHIVAVYDAIGGSCKLYVDGVSVGTPGRTPNANLSSTGSLYMLAGDASSLGSLGTIDEVAVYSVPLTAQQVLDHYMTGRAVGAYERDVMLTPGVVSYWRLGEPSGSGFDYKDSNPLTSMSAGVSRAVTGLLPGDTDKAVQLDGAVSTRAFANYTANMNVGAKVSLEAWVKPNAVVSGARIAGRISASATPNWFLDIAPGPLYRFRVVDSGSTTYTVTGVIPVVGTAVHLVGVYDSVAQTIKLYANGVEVASAATGTNVVKNDSGYEFFVGAEASTPAFNGVIDEVAFYNVALTPAQILSRYLIGSSVVLNTDTPTGIFRMSGTVTESFAQVRSDAPTGLFKLSGTRTESFAGPIKYTDAPTDIFKLSGSLAESYLNKGATEWYSIKIRERPPLRHHVDLVTPSGRHYRWANDEPRAENIFSGLRFGSTMPGGYDSCDCVLPRKPGVLYNDLERFSTLRILGAGGNQVGEYRLERTPQTSGDQMAISPSAVGWQAHLDDNKDVSILFVDRQLAGFSGPSARRTAAQFSDGLSPRSMDIHPDPVTANPTLDIGFDDPGGWPLGSRPEVEAWYDAGPGNVIGRIRGRWQLSGSVDTASPNWWLAMALTNDDNFGGGTIRAGAGNLAGASIASDVIDLVGTGTAKRRFAVTNFFYQVAGGGTGNNHYGATWTKLRLFGDHLLPIYGSTPDTEGLLCSDIVAYAIRKWCPLLNITTGSIQATTYFIIQQLTFRDMTTTGEIVKQATRFNLEDFAVWDNRTFFLNQRNNNPNAKRWRARIGPAKLEQTGQQADQLWESVVVSFQDTDKLTKFVGPPGSGMDYEDAALKDSDPENPANKLGIIRRDKLDMGIGTLTQATAAGAAFLREQKALDRSGRASLVGHVEDDHGILYPYSAVKAGDSIAFTDAADTSYRRIMKVNHDDASKTASVDLDAPPEGLQAVLERIGVQLSPLGLS